MTTATTESIDRLVAQIVADRHIPRTTYRIQFSPEFTFRDALAIVPYLRRLGITDLYASPLQKAMPGSGHGYDVCDPTQLNPELGTTEDFAALTAALAEHDMGLLLDIVPNHMGIFGDCNLWWADVLENGPASAYAHYFDIDWSPVKPELVNKVLLAILEDQYGNVLDSGKLRLTYTEGAFAIHYADFKLPLDPCTYAAILEPALALAADEADAENAALLELQSVLTAIVNLPSRDVDDTAQRAVRQREKESIKRRLAALVNADETLAGALERALTTLNGLPGDPRSFDRLDALINAQAYRLAYWRVAGEEINYRRFFDVNSMAAIRNELPDVFKATHGLVMDLIAAGQVNGLRVDHPDGLWDPPGYFRALQAMALARQVQAALGEDSADAETVQARVEAWLDAHGGPPPLYVIAEKILSEHEPLPPDWAVDGTTGYDFMNQVNGVFVDQRNEAAFDRLYHDFTGKPVDFAELQIQSKRMIMNESLAGEIHSLAHQLERLAEQNRHYRDFTLDGLRAAIQEIVACMSIYRTYIAAPDAVSQRDQAFVEAAVQDARQRNPRVSQTLFNFVRDCLLLRNYYEFDEPEREGLLRWVMRFQQVTGPVMAKSVEDTAFYVYNRLVSLNEVGGHPSTFGHSVEAFHQQNAERQRDWPYAMTSTSTHDTKRSEDVRARLNALSEMPDAWADAVTAWHDLNAAYVTQLPDGPAPDANDEYLLYQALVGAWTANDDASDEARAEFASRIQAYMAKATREAKVRTSWTHADPGYDQAVAAFVARILDPARSGAFLTSFKSMVERVAFYGRINSLSQIVLKILSPGVPDTYRGAESWDFSLVDPDNRRPVDYARLVRGLDTLDAKSGEDLHVLAEQLARDLSGDAKLFITQYTLTFRSQHADLFAHGSYHPLTVEGEQAEHAVAFEWRDASRSVVVIVPRLVLTLTNGEARLPVGAAIWTDTTLTDLTAAQYRDIFTGDIIDAGTTLRIADVLTTFPVAVLASDA